MRMSYRILIGTGASEAIRTFSAHVVERVGHLLGELAELVELPPPQTLAYARPRSSAGQELRRVDLGDCALLYSVDVLEKVITVLSIEHLDHERAATS